MGRPGDHQRLWIDVEHGARFGDAADSVDMVDRVFPMIGVVDDIWIFARSSAARNRGFYYPRSAQVRFGVPKAQGPLMVLIDDAGDQIWLSGASCRPGGVAAAREIMTRLDVDLDILDGGGGFVERCDEIHIADGQVRGVRMIVDPVPSTPPGRTFILDDRLVSRMEFDKGGVGATDLSRLWAMATEPRAWLGRPIALTLYDSQRRALDSGYDGCQLIAIGESGRELWMQLPEPDEYGRVSPGRLRNTFDGSITEYESAVRWIFRGVGVELPSAADRSLRDKLIGVHREDPAVVCWP